MPIASLAPRAGGPSRDEENAVDVEAMRREIEILRREKAEAEARASSAHARDTGRPRAGHQREPGERGRDEARRTTTLQSKFVAGLRGTNERRAPVITRRAKPTTRGAGARDLPCLPRDFLYSTTLESRPVMMGTRLWSVGQPSRRRLVVVVAERVARARRSSVVVVVVVVVSPVVSRHGVARRARAGRRPHRARARRVVRRVDIVARANATRRRARGGPVVVVVVVTVTVVTVASGRARAVGGDGTTREDTLGTQPLGKRALGGERAFRWLVDAIEAAAEACAEEALEEGW